MMKHKSYNEKQQKLIEGQGLGLGLGFFYFILNSSPLTRDVTCSVTLLGRTK